MKVTYEDLNEMNKNVDEVLENMAVTGPALNAAGDYIQRAAQIIALSGYVFDQVAQEREVLYRILISFLLDHGLYDYTVDKDSLPDMSKYKFDMEVEESTVKFSLRFPEQPEND